MQVSPIWCIFYRIQNVTHVMTPQSWRDSYGCVILKPKKLSHSNPSSSHNFKPRNNKFPPVVSLSKLEKIYWWHFKIYKNFSLQFCDFWGSKTHFVGKYYVFFVIKKSILCTTIVKYVCLPFAILVSEKTKSLRVLELVVLRPFENSDPI